MDIGLSTVAPLLTMTCAGLLLACPDGTFRPSTPGCQKCSVCPRGWGETSPCSSENDTVCIPCPAESFSSKDFHVCEPCTQCHWLKQRQRQACNATHDAVCGDCLHGFYFDMEYLRCRRHARPWTPASPPTTDSSNRQASDEVTEVTEAMLSPSLTSTNLTVTLLGTALAAVICVLGLGVLVATYLIRRRQKDSVSCWSRQNISTESHSTLCLMVQESTMNEAPDLSSVSLPIQASPGLDHRPDRPLLGAAPNPLSGHG